MDIDPRIKKLRDILEDQIEWYEKNRSDEGLVYDEMWSEFAGLPRGAYLEIIETILESD